MTRLLCTVAAALSMTAAALAAPDAAVPADPLSSTARARMTPLHATGHFDVKLEPQSLAKPDEASRLGRMTIDKTFHGDLDATSRGEMLTAQTGTKGSAGYVAIEQVTGRLQGRSGSFVLQHSGTLDRGAPALRVSVVPDSGTGELTGLTGTLSIDIRDGQHCYALDYALPPATTGP